MDHRIRGVPFGRRSPQYGVLFPFRSTVIRADGGYNAGSGEPAVEIARLLSREPDLIVLPNLAPGDAARLIRGARASGFRGHFATEAAQDAHSLYEALGDEADGKVMLGGALSRGQGSA